MNRKDRQRARLETVVPLEVRLLLAAPEILGNAGHLVFSQFQPYGIPATVGTQFRGVTTGGPIQIHVDTGAPEPAAVVFNNQIVNSGEVANSQFNGGGFRTIGLQFSQVQLGKGLTVSGSDNEDTVRPPSSQVLPPLANRNTIVNSQFNDGGFGNLEIKPNGDLVTTEGRVGLQWNRTKVKGPVNIAIDNEIVQPNNGSATPIPMPLDSKTKTIQAKADSEPGQTIIDFSTNSGQIKNSQFNDGGFGDIGMQWSQVKVSGRVGTTSNSLFIKPEQANLGPITIKDRVFGQRVKVQADRSNLQALSSDSLGSDSADISAQASAFRTTFTNSATNSGTLLNSQFNDGGFGDVGLQWSRVRVGGNVEAAHNSLTVQPENKGQGLIDVERLTFPVRPSASPDPAPSPLLPLDPSPSIIANDGEPVANLPKPTGPRNPFFPTPFAGTGTRSLGYPGNYPLVNAASNSGLIRDSQFNAGGFGDQAAQWQGVRVRDDVNIIHNSLSVHPEGSQLAGINVADVAYGDPITANIEKHLAILPAAVISTGNLSNETSTASGRATPSKTVLPPYNNLLITNQQLASTGGTDVFLQWNGIQRDRGLVIVHNIIKITGVGPETGPILLSNIRFPYKVPPFAPLETAALQPRVTVKAHRGVAAKAESRDNQLLNSANNSGILNHAQFSDGGFGDDGLQWHNVTVNGSVDLVHNTFAVDASADLPAGDVSGPITISNVSFNSGLLQGDLSRASNQIVVSPPDVFQRVSSHPIDLGKPLKAFAGVRDDAANSGIMLGGQLAAGGANHAMLQWRCVKINGSVRVIDNVLSISVLDRPSRPITISNVTFA